jgi:hypothetical protein
MRRACDPILDRYIELCHPNCDRTSTLPISMIKIGSELLLKYMDRPTFHSLTLRG